MLLAVWALASCTASPAKPARPAPAVQAPAPQGEAPAPELDTPGPGAVAAVPAKPAGERVRRWSFDSDQQGAPPAGWSAPIGTWAVAASEGAPSGARVLVQTAANASPVFNIALVDDASHADSDISTRVRAIKGRIDQGGGVVWRAKDARSYYIARYSPLEDNYRVYYVQNGRRRQLGSADVKLEHEAWHTVRVRMVGNHIEGYLDGEKHLDVRNDTFKEAGKVGLWTKADAHTEFDDLQVVGLDGTASRGDTD
jgi:hypothetical protein